MEVVKSLMALLSCCLSFPNDFLPQDPGGRRCEKCPHCLIAHLPLSWLLKWSATKHSHGSFKKTKVPSFTRSRSRQSFPLAWPLTGGSAPCWRSPRCLQSAELPGFARLECWTPPQCAPGAAGLVWWRTSNRNEQVWAISRWHHDLLLAPSGQGHETEMYKCKSLLITFIQRYSPLLSRLTALLLHVIVNEWLAFHSVFWTSTKVVCLQLFGCYMAGATWNYCCLGAGSVYTIQPCTMSCHFTQSHVRGVHASLAVTCHLHFWQNDRGLLRATA